MVDRKSLLDTVTGALSAGAALRADGGKPVAIAVHAKDKMVRIDFGGEPIKWMALDKAHAVLFAQAILKEAGEL